MTASAAGSRPKLVVFGNLVLDDVVSDDGSTRFGQAGGAVAYCALGAALWRRPTGIVSIAGGDYPESVLKALAGRGIDLDGVRRSTGPGLRSWLLYEGELRRVVHRLAAPSHHRMSPTPRDLPAAWQPRAIHVAPMPLDRQAEILDELAARPDRPLISVDPFELVTTANEARCREALGTADVLFVSRDELRFGTGPDGGDDETGAVHALNRLARWGPRYVLVKEGSRGGTARDSQGGIDREWPGRARRVVDPTGAGDAFAGGLLAGLAFGEDLEAALERAVVSASFALESSDLVELAAVSSDRAEQRRAEWFS